MSQARITAALDELEREKQQEEMPVRSKWVAQTNHSAVAPGTLLARYTTTRGDKFVVFEHASGRVQTFDISVFNVSYKPYKLPARGDKVRENTDREYEVLDVVTRKGSLSDSQEVVLFNPNKGAFVVGLQFFEENYRLVK